MQSVSTTSKPCVCTGIRSCALCSPDTLKSKNSLLDQSNPIYIYCLKCNHACPVTTETKEYIKRFLNQIETSFDQCFCHLTSSENLVKPTG